VASKRSKQRGRERVVEKEKERERERVIKKDGDQKKVGERVTQILKERRRQKERQS